MSPVSSLRSQATATRRETRNARSEAVRKKLLSWFRRTKRQLPWRGTRDPYRIWVSEVMLQQTTVAAVRKRYEPFLSRFHDLPALARAREQSVLAAWSGLGYYARARNLHRAARLIVRSHGGKLPREPGLLRMLPGFGEYMSAAVASLAFGRRIPAADANVTRVLSRLFAIPGTAGRRRHGEAVKRCAEALIDGARPGEVTAALMDLGQLICTPRKPRCRACPLALECTARRQNRVDRYPRRPPKHSLSQVDIAAACAARDGRTLLVRRDAPLLGGLWQFPSAEANTPTAARRRLARVIAPLGLRLDGRARPSVTWHTMVHKRLRIGVFHAVPIEPKSKIQNPKSTEIRWFRPAELDRAAIPTLTRKIAAARGFLPEPRKRMLRGYESRDFAHPDHGSG